MPESNDYIYKLFRKLGLTDFGADTASLLLRRPLEILLIFIAAIILSRIGARVASRSVRGLVARSVLQSESTRANSRADTLAGVVASMVRITVWVVAVLLVLDKLGINLGPLIAGASIVGVAVGFGAQSLVRDFLSGFFVLAEDQFGVGDAVTVSDVTGTVEEVNLRITRLRAADGTVWFVPNGEIRKVGNSAKDWSKAIVDICVPAGTDLTKVSAAIADEVGDLGSEPAWEEAVLEPPEVLGVDSMGTDGFTVQVSAKTKPTQRAKVARELRARISERLRRDGLVPAEVTEGKVPAAAPDAAGGASGAGGGRGGGETAGDQGPAPAAVAGDSGQ